MTRNSRRKIVPRFSGWPHVLLFGFQRVRPRKDHGFKLPDVHLKDAVDVLCHPRHAECDDENHKDEATCISSVLYQYQILGLL